MKEYSPSKLYVIFYHSSESVDTIYVTEEAAQKAYLKIPESIRNNYSVMSLEDAIYDVKRNYHDSFEFPDERY